MPTTNSAVVACVAAVADRLAEASRTAEEARAALDHGEQDQVLGNLLPIEQLLKDVLSLYSAAVVLHLESR